MRNVCVPTIIVGANVVTFLIKLVARIIKKKYEMNALQLRFEMIVSTMLEREKLYSLSLLLLLFYLGQGDKLAYNL